ncbi:MAG: hypothetical protein QG630_498 [Patescibacteria group bacterium]|nr:hypothetical protein [Patescibacteria group bacterium]
MEDIKENRKTVQNILIKLDLGITFYNIFKKINTSSMKDSEGELFCFAKNKEVRETAIEELKKEKWECQKITKRYFYEEEEYFAFKVFLRRE